MRSGSNEQDALPAVLFGTSGGPAVASSRVSVQAPRLMISAPPVCRSRMARASMSPSTTRPSGSIGKATAAEQHRRFPEPQQFQRRDDAIASSGEMHPADIAGRRAQAAAQHDHGVAFRQAGEIDRGKETLQPMHEPARQIGRPDQVEQKHERRGGCSQALLPPAPKQHREHDQSEPDDADRLREPEDGVDKTRKHQSKMPTTAVKT